MSQANVLWLTERSEFHQQRALNAAPDSLNITMFRQPDDERLKKHLASTEILVSERRGIIDVPFLEKAPQLKFILRLGAIIFDIDLEAAQKRNIKVSRQPDRGNIRVAEHCLTMMLALSKQLNFVQRQLQKKAGTKPSARTDENTFAYNWAETSTVGSVHDKVIGIIGMGNIGFELVRRLHPMLPADILYHKRTQLPTHAEESFGIHYASFDEVLRQSDIIVTLLPYTPATDHVINADKLALMKPHALLIQSGSGSTIDEQAVANALLNHNLGGVAFDTFEYEPLPADNPLLLLSINNTHPNIILTPHIAGGTLPDASGRAYQFEDIQRFLAGKPLKFQVNS